MWFRFFLVFSFLRGLVLRFLFSLFWLFVCFDVGGGGDS